MKTLSINQFIVTLTEEEALILVQLTADGINAHVRPQIKHVPPGSAIEITFDLFLKLPRLEMNETPILYFTASVECRKLEDDTIKWRSLSVNLFDNKYEYLLALHVGRVKSEDKLVLN